MSVLPPELAAHKTRLSRKTFDWLSAELGNDLPLDEFGAALLDLVEANAVVDTEVAYLAAKAGVITGQLEAVIALHWEPRHPAVRAYQALAWLFLNSVTEAERNLRLAEDDAQALNDPLVDVDILGVKAFVANALHDYPLGVEALGKTRQLVKRNHQLASDNQEFFSFALVVGAKSLLKLGRTQKALQLSLQVLRQNTSNRFIRSLGLINVGHCLDVMGKTREAVSRYKRALQLAQTINAYPVISIAQNRLGMAIAWRMDDLLTGQQYFAEALRSADLGQALWLREGPLWNLTAVHQALEDWPAAIEVMRSVVDSAQRVGQSQTELVSLLNLAELLEEDGQHHEAAKTREAAHGLATIIGVDMGDLEDDEEEDEEEEEENGGYELLEEEEEGFYGEEEEALVEEEEEDMVDLTDWVDDLPPDWMGEEEPDDL